MLPHCHMMIRVRCDKQREPLGQHRWASQRNDRREDIERARDKSPWCLATLEKVVIFVPGRPKYAMNNCGQKRRYDDSKEEYSAEQ